jgi:hypothetical protein
MSYSDKAHLKRLKFTSIPEPCVPTMDLSGV